MKKVRWGDRGAGRSTRGRQGGRGGDRGFGGRLVLGGRQGQQFVAGGLDLALHGGRVERGVLGGQAPPAQGGDGGVGAGADVRGAGPVILLGDLRSVADLGDQL